MGSSYLNEAMADSLTSEPALLELEALMRNEFFTNSSVPKDERAGEVRREILVTRSSSTEFLAELEKLMKKEFFLPQSIYNYGKFNSKSNIRLLHLEPGGRNDVLDGYLEEVAIGSNLKYEALSYTWGASAKPHKVFTSKGFLSITSSLRSALIRFRYTDRARILWIDALCINQDDNDEKSDQILLMPKIYSFASKVLVYLGDDANGSQHAVKLIDKIAKANFSKLQSRFDQNGELFRLEHFGLPPNEDNVWRALWAFWCRPWFRRVWIIQEFLLGQAVSVVCGEWQRDWKIFFEVVVKFNELGLIHRGTRSTSDLNEVMEANSGFAAMSLLCHYRAQANQKMYVVDRIRLLSELPHSSVLEAGELKIPGVYPLIQMLRQNPDATTLLSGRGTLDIYSHLFGSTQADPGEKLFTGMPLVSAFDMTETSQATEAKDRMFALFSLANDLDDQDRSLLRPDYNMSPSLIVCRYASVLIRKGYGMNLLYRGSIRPRSLQMPSWAPDWTIANDPLFKHALLGIAGAQIYQAGGNMEARMRIGKNEDVLVGTGSFIDAVEWVGVVPGMDTISFMEVDRMCDGLSSYPTEEPLSEVKWRTLVANKTTKGRSEAPKEYGIQYKAWKECIDGASFRAKTMSQQLALCPSSSGAFAEALGTVRHYKLCRTRGGYVGLVPLSTIIGDSISVFLGGIIPFVLRKSSKSDRNDMFRVVGGCYIHGWMKGEALRFPQWHEQDIHLH